MKFSKHIYYANNGMNTFQFGLHEIIIDFITKSNPLPEEFADIIKIDLVEVEDGIRGIINWA